MRVESAHGVLVIGRDEDHGRTGVDQLEDLEAVELRHLDVEEKKVGGVFGDGFDGLEAVGAFGSELDLGVGAKEFAQEGAGQLLVVHDHRAQHH